MDEWIDVTTLHDPERVFVNQRTGERRTEPFDPPSAEVQRRVDELRERRAAAGLVRVEVWVRPEDAERVRRYAAKVARVPLAMPGRLPRGK